jgi:hypothetical protein
MITGEELQRACNQSLAEYSGTTKVNTFEKGYQHGFMDGAAVIQIDFDEAIEWYKGMLATAVKLIQGSSEADPEKAGPEAFEFLAMAQAGHKGTIANLVDGKVYIAPNGVTKVKIYPMGYIEPFESEISEKAGELIQEMSAVAQEKLGPKASPTEIFEFMGWKPYV